ncbi:hypothetical protein K458DRAFT_397196 [Lentithecium fluviatile CBS 122367]|uniref:PhoD-like phosphatase metallophosphatase domain-containing protein n=1 Tax=Lentithecium fluviatile CBS 122367 TaxID=1168545 RepID=A0A6G1ID80_9PLEO|nr:hypothetical protein K458DRAFT_397196 [Lentithecium fluviatile CBS 122367]
MLDKRNHDRSITSLGWNKECIASIKDDAGRTLMGNQIIFSRINNTPKGDEPLVTDGWDVRLHNKPNHILHHLYANNISNTVFLTGDSHSNWVSDLVWLD